MENTIGSIAQYIVFKLDEQVYGIDIQSIQNIEKIVCDGIGTSFIHSS